MSKLVGTLDGETKVLVLDLHTNTLLINAVLPSGPFSFPGLSSYEKFISAMRTSDGKSVAFGKVTPVGEDPVEATFNVLSGGDDCSGIFENDVYGTGDTLHMYRSTGIFGVRFRNIPIPKGSTIEEAFVRLWVKNTNNRYINAQIFAENSANPIAFQNSTEFNARVKTSPVAWNSVAGGVVGGYLDTPNISSIVSPLVNLDAWEVGNPIHIIIDALGGDPAGPYRDFAAFEHTTLPQPELHLRYVSP